MGHSVVVREKRAAFGQGVDVDSVGVADDLRIAVIFFHNDHNVVRAANWIVEEGIAGPRIAVFGTRNATVFAGYIGHPGVCIWGLSRHDVQH